jgi:hypothetical protein
MVTGRRPYEADTPAAILIKQASDPLPHPKTYIPNLPEGVERTILRALAKKPGDRYPDTSGFISALEALLSEKDSRRESVVPRVSTPSGSTGKQAKSRAKAVRAEETEDEFGTRTEAVTFEEPPAPARAPAAKSLPFFGIATCAGMILLLAFGSFFAFIFTTRPTPIPTIVNGTNPPDPRITDDSTQIVDPTNTSQSTRPTDLPPPTITVEAGDTPIIDDPPPSESLTPYFTASSDLFCREGPSTSYEIPWQLEIGQTVLVLAKWSGDSNWLLVEINEPAKTRTQCCWVSGSNGTLNVSLKQIKTTNIVPDRMDCDSVR